MQCSAVRRIIFHSEPCHILISLNQIDLIPLGMESVGIPDSSITASSQYDNNHHAYDARPNTQRNSGKSWCTRELIPYLQVDLRKITTICGIGTQRRLPYENQKNYPKTYSVEVSNDSTTWTFMKQYGEIKVGSDQWRRGGEKTSTAKGARHPGGI